MKRGLIGMILLGVLVVLVLGGIVAGIYFYNYYVFKEVRACVGNWRDTQFPCGERSECLSGMNYSDEKVIGAPSLIQDNFDAILNSAVYCDGTCFVGEVRGIDPESGTLVELDSCEVGEEEFVVEIHGKDAWEILNWLKEMEQA